MLIESPHLTDIQALELAYATTCQELDKAKTVIEELQEEIAALKEKLRLAQSKEFGKSSEQSSSLPPPDELNRGESTTVSGYTRKAKNAPRGRTTDLSHLPHFQIHHDLPEEEKRCTCCQAPLVLIGKDTTKKLEVLPQKLYVAEHLCYKYTCRTCETMIEAKKEKSAIPKGLGGDSLIAEILENKYQHHLPLYRQSLMLANLDAPISDNTLGNWVMQVGDGLRPLYDAFWKAVLGSRYLQVDETPFKMLKPDKQGYLWTYFAPLVGQGLVVFEASLTRSGEVAKKRLAPFNGLLQTDAYNGYQSLRSRKGIIPCGCLSHARRKFKEVITASGDVNGVAAQMVERLKPLYQLEERMRTKHLPHAGQEKATTGNR
jgi:transposase